MGAAGGSAANAKAPAPEPEHRISTGNAGLDSMLEGGVIPRRPYLIVGPAGTGKTSLALEFLCEGIRRGERSLIVTLEEPPNEMRINHRGLGAELDRVEVFDAIPDVMRYERVPFKDISAVRSSLPFSRVPYVIRRTPELTGVEVTITGLEQMLRSEIARRGFTRVVIDSLTALQYFCMKGFNEVAGAQTFLRFLSDLQVTTLLTVESPLEDVDTTERILARGEVRLFRWELDGLTVRAVGVEKFRGGSHDIRLHPYRIGPQGLDINVQVTISRDTRQIVEPVPVVAVAAAAPAVVGSPLDPLTDEVQDLVAIGADTTAVRTAIESAIAAVKSNDATEAGAAIARASALAMDVAGDYRGASPPPTSPSPAAAEAMKRVLARADSARGGVAPTTLPPLSVLAQQLEEVRAVLATATPPPAPAPPPKPLTPAVEVPAAPPVPPGALASPPPAPTPAPPEPVVESPPPVAPAAVPPPAAPPVSPPPTPPPPPAVVIVAPAPAPEPAAPVPSPPAPPPAVPPAAPPRVTAPSPPPAPVAVAPVRAPTPTATPTSAEPPPPPLPPPARSAPPKPPSPAPAATTAPTAPPPGASPPPFPTRAAPPAPAPKSVVPEAVRAPPPPRRAAPPEPPRLPSAAPAVRPGAPPSTPASPKGGTGATGEARRPVAEGASRAGPPPLPQMGAAIAPPPPPPPPPPPAALPPPAETVPVAPVPPSSVEGPPPPSTPSGGASTGAPAPVPPSEAPIPEPPTVAAPAKKKAKRATRPAKKVAAPEPATSPPGEAAPDAASGATPGEPPAPVKPRRKAVRKRKAPSVISAMPGTVPPGEAAAADTPPPAETAPPVAAPPPEAPKEGG